MSERAASGTGVRARVESFLVEEVWAVDLVGLGWLRRQAYRAARIAYLTARGFRDHRASTRASGLTYVTVLSIVPLLAMGFSVAKGFRAYDRLRADVVEYLLADCRYLGPAVPPQLRTERMHLHTLLKSFIDITSAASADKPMTASHEKVILWQAIIHAVFLVSMILFAWGERMQRHGDHE